MDRIEAWLFDVLGLAVPGAVLIFLFSFPLWLVDPDKAQYSFDFSQQSLMFNIIKNVSNEKILDVLTWPIIIAMFIGAYLLGTIVKVLSKYQYDLCTVLFDKGLNRMVLWIGKLVRPLFIRLTKRIYHLLYTRSKIAAKLLRSICKFIEETCRFFKGLISNIFCFDPPNYSKANEYMVKKVEEKLKVSFMYEPSPIYPWYQLYKFSSVILAQDKVETLAIKHLAKYNLYRSLAFIFLLNILYLNYFYSEYPSIIHVWGKQLQGLLLIISFIAWLAFHEKFQRYWTFCGSETLISIFYHIFKGRRKNE